jgi:hypothetical protein
MCISTSSGTTMVNSPQTMTLAEFLSHLSKSKESTIHLGGATHKESEDNMNIPKNCSECPYTSVCHAPHYGGSRCEYEKEIVEKTLKGGEEHD